MFGFIKRLFTDADPDYWKAEQPWMTSRRSFLRGVGGIAATAALAPLLRWVPEPAKCLTKEEIIAAALETDEGRRALAQAMVEPIRRSLEYDAVGRKILMVDDLPSGALDRYERDVASVSHVITRYSVGI